MKCPRCKRACVENDLELKKNGKPYKTCCKCRKKPEDKKLKDKKEFNRKEHMQEYYQNHKGTMDKAAREYYRIVYAKDSPKTMPVDRSKEFAEYYKNNRLARTSILKMHFENEFWKKSEQVLQTYFGN